MVMEIELRVQMGKKEKEKGLQDKKNGRPGSREKAIAGRGEQNKERWLTIRN